MRRKSAASEDCPLGRTMKTHGLKQGCAAPCDKRLQAAYFWETGPLLSRPPRRRAPPHARPTKELLWALARLAPSARRGATWASSAARASASHEVDSRLWTRRPILWDHLGHTGFKTVTTRLASWSKPGQMTLFS